EVDPQVALTAHDRPEPADLGRAVPLDRPLAGGPDQPAFLVADQDPEGDRELAGDLVAGDDGSAHGHLSRRDRVPGAPRRGPPCRGRAGCGYQSPSRGRIGLCSPNSRIRRRLSSSMDLGTTTLRTTNRSPSGLSPEAGRPWPRSLSFSPLELPGGTVSDRRP